MDIFINKARLAVVCLMLGWPAWAGAQQAGDEAASGYDADAALEVSQAAVGRELGEFYLYDSQGKLVNMNSYRGKPLLVSMIFTSCYHICPAITRHLAVAVDSAREALGEDSFNVVTIGFDTARDTADAMRVFAREQGIDDERWDFLSGSAETMAGLVENLGFVHFPSPRGFDHINQVTVIDADGVIYRQVYGAAFDLPWLVEPLKDLVFNRPRPGSHMVAGLVDRIKLFCTVYDPTTGKYKFDYSLFVGMAIGALFLLAVLSWLLLEIFRARRAK